MSKADATAVAHYIGAFFDEMVRCGVRDVVISPGSRSTPLSVVAFEMSRQRPDDLRIYVDVDERGASFFALGLAKASGRPACVVCTSGTALANYYPAVLEAETSRVPLVVLSADRPERMQGMGAPQTCDQLKAYGPHVRRFQQMAPAGNDAESTAFARQAAREACRAALGGPLHRVDPDDRVASVGCMQLAGPVQCNFPLEEPLMPDVQALGLFEQGRVAHDAPAALRVRATLDEAQADCIRTLLAEGKTLVLAGEGSCETVQEARNLLAWACENGFPVLADPLSGLRSFDHPAVIDNYDAAFRKGIAPLPNTVVRFGRYPVSKPCTTALAAARPLNVVVDAVEMRDWLQATDVYLPMTPVDFVASMRQNRACSNDGSIDAGNVAAVSDVPVAEPSEQREFLRRWQRANDAMRDRVSAADAASDQVEGAYVRAILREAPEGSCVFSANSLSIRALDAFCTKAEKRLPLLCNRGQNGIDGIVSTALGVSQTYRKTTFLVGDFTMLHDLNALALQRELLRYHGGEQASSTVIVLFNNNGGGIFEVLPQKSAAAYFDRLFTVPQDVRFRQAAEAFSVPYRFADSVEGFVRSYRECLQTPGISLIEISLSSGGVKERFERYW